MDISYSTWKDWKDCPKRYFLKHRKKEPFSVSTNDYSKIYGLITQAFFTNYANIWRFNTPYMPEPFIQKKVDALWETILTTLTVDWSAYYVKYTADQIKEQAFKDICLIMATPETQNLFLNTKAEVEIKLKTKEEVNITGRLDFIHTNPISNEVLIFDGKGTDKIKKNIDENQLLYYMLLYWFLYKEIPQQTGFFYYRFNLFAPMVVGVSQINKFRAQLSLDIKALLKESEFKATPSYTVCKYCGYKATCKEKEDREKISKKPSKITNLPESGGIVQFSF